MARGHSGRIVIEVEPERKKQLYDALDIVGSTLKEWFVKTAENFCAETNQPSLFSAVDLSDAGKSVLVQNTRQKRTDRQTNQNGHLRQKKTPSR